VRGDPADDLDKTGAACVDDPRLPEHVELVACLLDRLVSPADDLREKLGQLGVPMCLGLLGERSADGEDRSLDGLAHGCVRRIGASPERGGHGAVLLVALDSAAHELGQDHARVPACPQQRRADDVVVTGLERLADGAHRQEHVRPRVAVGHRVDVEVVEPGAVAFQGSLGRAHELEHLAHRSFISRLEGLLNLAGLQALRADVCTRGPSV
jgi:hypothetical protein